MQVEFVHVGYKFFIDEKVREELKLIIGEKLTSTLDTNPIVAIKHLSTNRYNRKREESQIEMKTWYDSKLDKNEPAFIRSIFIDKQEKHAVMYVTVGSQHIWSVIHRGTNLSPLKIKEHVGSGKYTEKKLKDKIPITVEVYKHEQPVSIFNF